MKLPWAVSVFKTHKLVGNLFLILFLKQAIIFSEEILQNFDSEADMKQFWDVSTWGNEEKQYSAENVKVENGILSLKITGAPVGTKPVICGEIASKDRDFLYGSYRASIKTTDIAGGVVGWFIYRDVPELREIDIEYLTENLTQIHFTLHYQDKESNHKVMAVDFDPSEDFHEYRFDCYPDSVRYFIDSKHYTTLTTNVPDLPCNIMLNHWSANIPDWGGPAPTQDIYMYVDYMHYYSDVTAVTKPGNNINQIDDYPLVIRQNNSIVDIQFDNTFNGWICLEIFNMNGRKIKIFTNDNFLSGKQTIRWNAIQEASGVYLLNLDTKEEKQSVVFKLILSN